MTGWWWWWISLIIMPLGRPTGLSSRPHVVKKKKVGENNGQLRFVRHLGWHTQARLDQNNGQLCFHGSRLDQLVKCESEAKCEAKYVKTTCQMMLKLRVKHFQRMLYKQIAVLNYIQFVMLGVFVRLYVMSGNI